MGIPIEPSQYAVHVETQEIERNVTEIPPAPLTQDEKTITLEDTNNANNL